MIERVPLTYRAAIAACIKNALAEDIGSGDITTQSIVPPELTSLGQIRAKQSGVIAGLDVAAQVFFDVDRHVDFNPTVAEGERVECGQLLAQLSGPVRGLLTAERTALNFLGRMSGIATLTRKFADLVASTQAKILDTRKTAPGLREVDKLAVRRGGGLNHRHGLFDLILIKDNHIACASSLKNAVSLARRAAGEVEIEVETRTIEELREALELGVKFIMLDNMNLETIRKAVQLTEGRAKLEASGNVSLANVRQIAETGVDFISVGELTHSAPVFDLSLSLDRRDVGNY
ncbi:MAG TPA: carboxylating nicotinate-nucleotide diphosphorylase [Pyrinomonadaceae bacterium]|nr:carboxylating nicotinate-nucleotide diphosphorylase [Pyrinomonadaceae bacterium]